VPKEKNGRKVYFTAQSRFPGRETKLAKEGNLKTPKRSMQKEKIFDTHIIDVSPGRKGAEKKAHCEGRREQICPTSATRVPEEKRRRSQKVN